MAAHRNGIKNVILPLKCKEDVNDNFPEDLLKEIKIHYADRMEQYLALALEEHVDKQFLFEQSYGDGKRGLNLVAKM